MTDIYYTKDHEWIKVDGGEGLVGITSYASEQLGDIVFVELPQKGISFLHFSNSNKALRNREIFYASRAAGTFHIFIM